MRNKLIIFAFSLFTLSAIGQQDPFSTGWGSLDYSVPQSPAFSILGTNPSNILQPTSAKSIALNVGNYLITNGSVIPKNLSVEISPALLNNNLSLNAYNKCKLLTFLYRTSLSLGTTTTKSGSYNLAEGIRFTLLDKTDLRANATYLAALATFAQTSASAYDAAIAKYAADHNLKPIDVRTMMASDTNFTNTIKNLVSEQYIIDTRTTYKQNNWNKSIIQIGGAALQTSTDSLAQNIKGTTKYDGWFSAGFPLWYSGSLAKNGQLLIGVKYERQDSNMTWINNASAGIRIYYGESNLKAYLQGQLNWINSIPTQTATLGCEYNLSNGLWIDLAINLITDQQKNMVIKPSFNINFGSPEKKKT